MTPEASTLLELGRLLLPDRSAVRSGLQRLHDSQLKYAVTSRDLAAGRKVERTLWGSSTIMSLWRLSLPPSLRQNFWLPAHVSQSPTLSLSLLVVHAIHHDQDVQVVKFAAEAEARAIRGALAVFFFNYFILIEDMHDVFTFSADFRIFSGSSRRNEPLFYGTVISTFSIRFPVVWENKGAEKNTTKMNEWTKLKSRI